MGGTERQDGLLMRAVDSIGQGDTLDDVLSSLVAVLQEPLLLAHANVALLRPGAATGEVLVAWSPGEDKAFEAGTQVSTTLTSDIRLAVQGLREGEVVVMSLSAGADSLASALLSRQGVLSVAVIPVHQGPIGVLLLTLGCREENVLEAVGVPFFRGLAAGIEDRLVELVGER